MSERVAADRTRPNWTGQRFVVDVGQVAHGGHCVARHEGRVVFVRHTLPGETVLVEVTEDHGGSFCRADAVEVHAAAAGRVTPPCPLADISRGQDRCGGCDWQHAAPDTQRELKAVVVREQLERIAGLDWPVEVQQLPGGPLRWRNRTRLAVDQAGNAGFRAHRSHRIIPIEDCPITTEDAVSAVTSRRWRPGAELGVTRDGTGEVHVSATDSKPRRQRGRRADPVVRQVRGSGIAREYAEGRTFHVQADGFWQVHVSAAETFAATVRRFARVSPGATAWDLYGGAGLFTAGLAEQAGSDGQVLLVESSRRAVADATANLADLPQVGCRTGTVERVLRDEDLPEPEVVVLDPPRKGAGKDVVTAVAARGPARVVHVACDPAALARDVSLFAEHGYRLAELEVFDAFPMTHHIECIALLQR
ncbi:TRAM domain-containing protein [Salinifilum aidingensis]